MKRLFTILLAMTAVIAVTAQNREWSFPGGKEKMQAFFEQYINYPESALKDQVEGIVYVYMTIDKKGKASDLHVGKSSSYPELDKEAVRVVKLVKEWVPQIKDGKAVDMNVVVPVEFWIPDSPNRFKQLKQEFIYPEGEEALEAYIKQHFQYPPSLADRKISGTLFVNFTIDENGVPSDYNISDPSAYPALDAEAVRVVKLVDKWIPTKDANGKPYTTRHIVRVDFAAPGMEDPVVQEEAPQQEPLVIAVNPSYPGGYNAMTIFISKNTRYPAEELEKGIEGDVEVGFTVNEDGSLSDVHVEKSVSKGLDAEALRIVKSMPKWEPAKTTDGKITPCQMSIPVNFRLPKEIDGVPFHTN